MSDVAVENQIDGSKHDVNENSNDIEDHNEDSNSVEEEPSAKKAKLAKENSVKDSKTTNDKDESEDSLPTPRGRGSRTSKRTPSKVKEVEGTPDTERRTTRSQTRGTPVSSIKKPARASVENSSKRSRRGRPRKEEEEKKDSEKEDEEEEEEAAETLNNKEEKESTENNVASDGTGEEEESQPENDKADQNEEDEEEEEEEEEEKN